MPRQRVGPVARLRPLPRPARALPCPRRRAPYEYAVQGTATNIAFHRAVMENPRFLRGEFYTHFIEKETGPVNDTRAILAEKRTLGDWLPARGGERTRSVAAADGATAAARLLPQEAAS